MTPPRASIVALSLVACAARSPVAPSPIARVDRADRSVSAVEEDTRLRALPARCVDRSLSLVAPSAEIVARCPWGVPECEAEAPIVVRNCASGVAKVMALSVDGIHRRGPFMRWEADPEAMQPLAPRTAIEVAFPLVPMVDRVRVRVDVARDGARDTLLADPRIRRVTELSPGSSEAFGFDAPIVYVASARDGRWTVACQARSDDDRNGSLEVSFGMHGETGGDSLAPFFLREGAPAEPIDDYFGADPEGRFVALARNGLLALRDTVRDVESALDTGDDRAERDDVSFDRVGQRMAYVRRRNGRAVVVVRTLSTGAEAVVDPGEGRLWKAWIDEAGAWVSLRVVARDGNRDGRLSAPATITTLGPPRCRGPVSSYYRSQHVVDPIETRVAPSTGGVATVVPGLLRPLGDSLLVREPKGELTLRDARGARVELVPATCGAVVRDGHAARRQVTVRCQSEARGGLVPLVIFEPGARVATSFEFRGNEAQPSDDELGASWVAPSSPPRYGDGWVYFIDRAHRAVRHIEIGHEVRWHAGERALLLRGDATLMFDIASGALKRFVLPGEVGYVEGSGAVVRWGRSLIDLEREEVLGEVRGDVLATATDGRALVPAVPGEGHAAPRGPLRWVRATAP